MCINDVHPNLFALDEAVRVNKDETESTRYGK